MLAISTMLAALSIASLLWLVLWVAVACLALWLLRYLLGMIDITIPKPIFGMLGVIVLILILLWFFGALR